MKIIFTVLPCMALYTALTHSIPFHRWGMFLLVIHSFALVLLMLGVIYGRIRSFAWDKERRRQFVRACISIAIVATSRPALQVWDHYRMEASYQTTSYWVPSYQPPPCQVVCHHTAPHQNPCCRMNDSGCGQDEGMYPIPNQAHAPPHVPPPPIPGSPGLYADLWD